MKALYKTGIVAGVAGALTLGGISIKDKASVDDYVTADLSPAGQTLVLKEKPESALERIAGSISFGAIEAHAGGEQSIYETIAKLDPKAMEALNQQKQYDDVISLLKEPLDELIEYGIPRLKNELEADKVNALSFAFNELGYSFKKKQMWSEAVRYFQVSIDLDNSQSAAYMNLGGILMKKGKNKEAARLFIKYLELKPNYENRERMKQFIQKFK